MKSHHHRFAADFPAVWAGNLWFLYFLFIDKILRMFEPKGRMFFANKTKHSVVSAANSISFATHFLSRFDRMISPKHTLWTRFSEHRIVRTRNISVYSIFGHLFSRFDAVFSSEHWIVFSRFCHCEETVNRSKCLIYEKRTLYDIVFDLKAKFFDGCFFSSGKSINNICEKQIAICY